MAHNSRKLGRAIALGGIVATAPLIAACSSGDSYDEWAATDGAAGRINLDDVQDAFKDSKSPTEFEKRVNEIYEGDGLVFIRSSQDGEQLVLEGWEDLNNSNSIEDAEDDLLFSIVKGTNEEYDMRGHNSNGHYNSHFGGGDFLFTYLLLSSFRGPGMYYYQTPPSRGTAMKQQRNTYRQSSRYRGQMSRNSRYTTKQQNFAGSRYQQQSRNVSSNRQTYQQTQRTSGGFKNSSAVSRSGSSFFASRGTSGRSTGGGGSQVILGRAKRYQ